MSKARIQICRIYADQQPDKGTRVLVDRIWPRGISKEQARLDHWYRDIAPSAELRKWFGHDPQRWAAFRQKYRKELKDEAQQERLSELADMARSDGLVLLYGAKDSEHNQAVVLRDLLKA